MLTKIIKVERSRHRRKKKSTVRRYTPEKERDQGYESHKVPVDTYQNFQIYYPTPLILFKLKYRLVPNRTNIGLLIILLINVYIINSFMRKNNTNSDKSKMVPHYLTRIGIGIYRISRKIDILAGTIFITLRLCLEHKENEWKEWKIKKFLWWMFGSYFKERKNKIGRKSLNLSEKGIGKRKASIYQE